MRTAHLVINLLVLTILALAPSAHAELRLPTVISDHAVLQRDRPVHIWGWADAGVKVTVRLAGKEGKATAGEDGGWSVKLGRLAAGGPHELTVETDRGERLIVRDLLVGEVWVCSGQSNMEWSVKHGIDDGEKHAAAADYPRIRLFDIPHTPAEEAQTDAKAAWQICTPESMREFSAIGYFFGRRLYQDLGVPVGLIGSNWGGTEAEPWTDLAALRREKRLAHRLEFWDSVVASDPRARLNPQRPGVLYNGMIAPITPYPARGTIWYQGESNVRRADEYTIAFGTLIESWRRAWGDSKMPFYFVQIAPFKYSTSFNRSFAVTEHALPLLWEQQMRTLDRTPHTGMVVVHDVGNVDDIHPRNKLTVGERLAAIALADTYGRKGLATSGPMYRKSRVKGGMIEVTFRHTGTGLATRDGRPPTHFEIAGEDGVFHPAGATISADDTVCVRSDHVANPKAVRFAWHETAEPNLMNKEGLPASPFRTDDWPVQILVP
jgi:sialate O-acetylesterase